MPHPLFVGVIVADLCAVALVLFSSVTAARVVMGWRPASADRSQIALERGVEVAALCARGAFALSLLGTAMLVAAVASVMPGLVPGAMCGTGVMQAMGPAAERALVLRGVALLALATWAHLDRLDRSRPDAPLTVAAARATLVAAPVVILAAVDTATAALSVDLATAVDCCSVVYDAARAHGAAAAAAAGGGGAILLVSVLSVGGVAVASLAIAASRRRWSRSAAIRWALALMALAWVPVAAAGLTRELAPYHYGVLAHDCPYCLFAARHRFVGYLLYGALAAVALDAPAALVAHLASRRVPALADAAAGQVRRAGARVAVASILFLAVALGPALSWRLLRGVWIDS